MDVRPHAVYRARAWVFEKIKHGLLWVVSPVTRLWKKHQHVEEEGDVRNSGGEGDRLLG